MASFGEAASSPDGLAGTIPISPSVLAAQVLNKIAVIEETIGDCTTQINRLLVPLAEVLERLATIPGIQRRTAEIIVTETGADMTQSGPLSKLVTLG